MFALGNTPFPGYALAMWGTWGQGKQLADHEYGEALSEDIPLSPDQQTHHVSMIDKWICELFCRMVASHVGCCTN